VKSDDNTFVGAKQKFVLFCINEWRASAESALSCSPKCKTIRRIGRFRGPLLLRVRNDANWNRRILRIDDVRFDVPLYKLLTISEILGWANELSRKCDNKKYQIKMWGYSICFFFYLLWVKIKYLYIVLFDPNFEKQLQFIILCNEM